MLYDATELTSSQPLIALRAYSDMTWLTCSNRYAMVQADELAIVSVCVDAMH